MSPRDGAGLQPPGGLLVCSVAGGRNALNPSRNRAAAAAAALL